MQNTFSDRVVRLLVVALGATAALVAPALAAVVGGKSIAAAASNPNSSPNPNPAVVPIRSVPDGYGRYGELSAQFWQWEFSLPITDHPLFQSGPVDCSAGQSGSVWFIGGTFTTTPLPGGVTLGQAARSCSIPAGKSLFFPLVNAECSSVSGDNLGDTSVAGLRQCATFFANFIDNATLEASVDGVPITGLDQYRVQSPPFRYGPLPDNNILQFFGLVAPEGTKAQSVSDGVHLLLYPLSPGAHTVKFHGELVYAPDNKFIEDITYNIIITP
jgi:hypothetical protein